METEAPKDTTRLKGLPVAKWEMNQICPQVPSSQMGTSDSKDTRSHPARLGLGDREAPDLHHPSSLACGQGLSACRPSSPAAYSPASGRQRGYRTPCLRLPTGSSAQSSAQGQKSQSLIHIASPRGWAGLRAAGGHCLILFSFFCLRRSVTPEGPSIGLWTQIHLVAECRHASLGGPIFVLDSPGSRLFSPAAGPSPRSKLFQTCFWAPGGS